MSNDIVRYETSRGEVVLSPDIIKKYLVHGDGRITDQEVMMFLKLCQYQKLNPFLREAYLIKYGDSPAAMVTGKEVLIQRATRNPQYDGHEAGVIIQDADGYTECQIGSWIPEGYKLIGGWARVWRKDWKHPVEIKVSLKEYARYSKKGELTRSWAVMPGTMIRKVALSQAIREALPEDTSNLYSPEEMPLEVDVDDLSEAPVTLASEEFITLEEVKEEGSPTSASPEEGELEKVPPPLDKKQIETYWAQLVQFSKELGHSEAWLVAAVQKRYQKIKEKLTLPEITQIAKGLKEKIKQQKPITSEEAQEKEKKAQEISHSEGESEGEDTPNLEEPKPIDTEWIWEG